MSINTNLNALRALRRLDEASTTRSRAFERLTSGSRINRAGDDAARLAMASSLNLEFRINSQAVRNVNDGISYLNVADVGMRQLKSVLMQLRELAAQSSNGAFSNVQRQSLDKEAQALQAEYNRIIDATKFNGISVFENQMLCVQAGVGLEGSLAATLASFSSVTRGDGTFQARQSFASAAGPRFVAVADLNGDGKLDLVTADFNGKTTSVLLGNGDGTFKARRSFSSGVGALSVAVADINGDGVLDILSVSAYASILLGNGDGTFKARLTLDSGGGNQSITLADFDGDGKLDLVSDNWSSDTLSVLLGNGDGTFQARRSFRTGVNPRSVSAADFNGDGVFDLVAADQSRDTLSVLLGNGDGTFQARRSFRTGVSPVSVSVADFDGDGVLDLVSADQSDDRLSVLLGNGDGTFKARRSFRTGNQPFPVSVADINGDGVLDLVSPDWGGNTVSILFGNGATTATFQGLTHLSGVSVATQSAAVLAQGQIDSHLDDVNAVAGVVSSALSRFGFAARLLSASAEAARAAAGRVTDVDVAEESARLVATDIRQTAAAAALAHALKGPELALKLLRA